MQSLGAGCGNNMGLGSDYGRLLMYSANSPTTDVGIESWPQYVVLPSGIGTTREEDAWRGVGAASSTAAHMAQQASGGQGFVGPQMLAAGFSATTLMVRNLPRRVTMKKLLKELDADGFGASFDFLYLPTYRSSGNNHGFAFLNFHSTVMAKCFFDEWHGTQRFGMQVRSRISISEADTQGFEANVLQWIRQGSDHSMPLILREFSVDALAASSSIASASGAMPPTNTGRPTSSHASSGPIEQEGQDEQEENAVTAPLGAALPMPAFVRCAAMLPYEGTS